MKKITYKKGEYSQFVLNNQRLYLETLPNIVRIKKMIAGFIPTKTLWSYKFSFYIRTIRKPWETAGEILDLLLNELAKCNDNTEFEKILNPKLDDYAKLNQARAEKIAFEKLGDVAYKAKKNYS
jgi:hypothetical protein